MVLAEISPSDAVIVGTGVAACLTAILTFFNARRTREVRDEVKSPNGVTTAEVVESTSSVVEDIRHDVAKVNFSQAVLDERMDNLESKIDDIRERSVELLGLVGYHMSDSHGPKFEDRRKPST